MNLINALKIYVLLIPTIAVVIGVVALYLHNNL